MKRKPHKIRIDLILLGFATLLIVACRSQRPVVENGNHLADKNNLQLISMLEQKTQRFHTLKARKADVDFYVNKKREKIKGNLAIYRDSMIAVSVIPALGYEMLRILCTKDSVIIINRHEKSYSSASFEYFKRKFNIPVEFDELQAILANEVFYYKIGYKDRIFKKQLKEKNNNHLYLVDAYREGERITNQGFEINPEGVKLERVFLTDEDAKTRMNINYDDFAGEPEFLFPRKMTIEMIDSMNKVTLILHFGQIVFNDSINVEFAAPSHYVQGELFN
ncbi:DUF4292 domain-containing protein [Bacteroidota bacterium]